MLGALKYLKKQYADTGEGAMVKGRTTGLKKIKTLKTVSVQTRKTVLRAEFAFSIFHVLCLRPN